MRLYEVAGELQESDEVEAANRWKQAGPVVDGRLVRDEVPNTSSISASFTYWDELSGIREVPMSAFWRDTAPFARDARTVELTKEIWESKEINPLIVAVDDGGPYILEGGHRYDALKIMKAKSFPAVVIIDEDG